MNGNQNDCSKIIFDVRVKWRIVPLFYVETYIKKIIESLFFLLSDVISFRNNLCIVYYKTMFIWS